MAQNGRTSIADLKNSCYGFAYAIDDSKEGGYVLNITNTAAILVCNGVTGKIEVDSVLNITNATAILVCNEVAGKIEVAYSYHYSKRR